ncbi:unnamed protein product, partial [marine sediment metagenome]
VLHVMEQEELSFGSSQITCPNCMNVTPSSQVI